MKNTLLAVAAFVAVVWSAVSVSGQYRPVFYNEQPDSLHYIDFDRQYAVIDGDTVRVQFLADADTVVRKGPLTEQDFIEVAQMLGVEVAAIKAVVEIEAGKTHQGFWSEGKPLINFDLSVFRQMASRNKVNLAGAQKAHPEVFARPNVAKYGSRGAAVQARFDGAAAIDSLSAIQGTFWGMFQIGGFNWSKCGTKSPAEFVELMSRSERDQLDLFAQFITTTGLLPALKRKNWAAFARGYNGPSYAARGYHTRLAAAYKKYS